VRLLLVGREEESLTVYTDGFRVYDPLDDDERYLSLANSSSWLSSGSEPLLMDLLCVGCHLV
jgi:transposase-like protein